MIFKKYTTPAYATRGLIAAIDLTLSIISLALACLLRYNFNIEEFSWLVFSTIWIYVSIVRILSFKFFSTYAVIVRYAGINDIKRIFIAISAGSLIMIVFSLVFRNSNLEFLLTRYGFILPFSILVIDYVLTLCLISAFRLLMPFLFSLFFYEKNGKINVIIIGAGQLGSQSLNLIKNDSKSVYAVVGILDDNPDLTKKYMDGIPIYNSNKLVKVINKYGVKKAIFAIKNIELQRKNEIVELCLENKLKVVQVPIRDEWNDINHISINQFKEIQIEDLLNRPPISIENEVIAKELRNKKVLISGAAGSIGRELVWQVLRYYPDQLILVDQAETPLVNLDLECKEKFDSIDVLPIIADIADIVRMSRIFEEHKPEIVFHAAGYKHVPMMEMCPREAVNVNVNGTRIIANCAHSFGVKKFVMVSTDKAVNPTNVMGATKRVAEMYIQSLNRESNTRFITTRFGNVLGSNGSVIPRFKKQIEKGGPVTVTHPEITRYFMTIPEAARLIIEAGIMGSGGEIYLFDMGNSVKILDLAYKMIRLYGLEPEKDIKIDIVGLRPGEKLKEELLTTEENSIKTHHPKIMRAKVRINNYKEVDKNINDLIGSIDSDLDYDLVKKIKLIIPEFKSNNSRFNILDAKLN